MIWQDVVFGIGGFVFALSLLPSIFSKDKPALLTSVINGVVLTLFLVAYATLGLWLGAIALSITTFLWYVLAIQKYLYDKHEK